MELDKEICEILRSNIEPYIHSDNTCDKVEEYFNCGNKPAGDYIELANYFRGKDAEIDDADESYKQWLNDLIENDMEKESIVVSALKEHYSNKEDLRKFVFDLDDIPAKLNQKWHFLISYWGYREYVTKYPESNKEGKINPIITTSWKKGNPFRGCPEGKIWYDNCRRLDIQ